MALTDEETLLIPQGSTYIHTFTYMNETGTAPIDIASYTAQVQMRSTVDNTTILYDSDTGSDFTITDGANGIFTLEIPDTITAVWSFTEAVYDIELTTAAAKKIRYLKGSVEVDPEVTR